MPFTPFTFKDNVNMNSNKTLDEWLDMTYGWKDPYPEPKVYGYGPMAVVRDDLIPGTKSRAAAFLMSKRSEEVMVYTAPRSGAAPASLMDAANKTGKKTKFFIPSSKRMSEIQACVVEGGADYEFHRIAAMPNLNRIAAQWAEDNGAFFIPMGLKHDLVTAALIRVAYDLSMRGFNPKKMAVATSTGTLVRALQIAMPRTEFVAVAVARNMQVGEIGRAEFVSSTRPFLQDTDMPTPFPCFKNYDAKAWERAMNDHSIDAVWNVGKPAVLKDKSILDSVDSYRDWPKNEIKEG